MVGRSWFACLVAMSVLCAYLVGGPVRAAAAPRVGPLPLGDPAAVTPAAAPQPVVPPAVVAPVTTPGPTIVTGTISVDTTWGPQGSPYLISSGVTVSRGVSLTLLPGTVVKLDGGLTRLVVEGQLLSLGTPSQNVIFTSINDSAVGGVTGTRAPAAGDWGQVEVSSPRSGQRPASVVDYTVFRYGGYSSAVMMCQGVGQLSMGAQSVVSNSVFSDSMMTDLTLAGPGAMKVTGNVFRDAACGIAAWPDTAADILNNTFEASLRDVAVQALGSRGMRVGTTRHERSCA